MLYLNKVSYGGVGIVKDIPEDLRKIIEGPLVGDVRIPDEIKKLKRYLFYYKTGLTGVDLNKVEDIGEKAFIGCKNIPTLYLGPQIKKLGGQCFRGMTKWTVRDFSHMTLTEDMQYVNYADHEVKEFIFGDNEILPNGFLFQSSPDSKLTSFAKFRKIMGNNENMPTYLDEAFTSIDISNCIYIGVNAFLARYSLEDIKFNTREEYIIDDNAFSMYIRIDQYHITPKLKRVDMDMVKSIGRNGFLNNRSLESVHIGSHCTSIGIDAFKGCNKKELVITIDQPKDSITGAPWGAINATIVWNK